MRQVAFGNRPYSISFPPAVKWLLIVNTALFVLYFIAVRLGFGPLFWPLRLVPSETLGSLMIWQPVTYLFLHDPRGFSHIIFNMIALYMFGAELERTWGTRRFLNYYFLCGIGAALCVIIVSYMTGAQDVPTIGASGAIYGLLLAFGILFPDTPILFMFVLPIPAKYFVMIMGAIAFLSSLDANSGGVSHIAHLGGMAFGYAYFRSALWKKRAASMGRLDLLGSVDRAWKDYKLKRAKKKFEVYMNKNRRPN